MRHAARGDLAPPARRCAARSGCWPRRLAPPVSRWKKSSRNGVTSLPRDARRPRPRRPVAQHAVVQLRVELLVRSGLATTTAAGAPERVARAQHRGDLLRASRPATAPGSPSRPGRSRGTRRSVAEHRDVERLEALERGADVEDRLHARAHDGDRRRARACRGRPTRPSVSRASRCTPPRPPVANTPMPGARGQMRGRGDRRRAVAAARDHRREVAHAALDDVVACSRPPPARRRRARCAPRRRRSRSSPARRPRARTSASISRATRRLSRTRQPVGDDRALQRDHRPARGERLGTSSWIASCTNRNGGIRPGSLEHQTPQCDAVATRSRVAISRCQCSPECPRRASCRAPVSPRVSSPSPCSAWATCICGAELVFRPRRSTTPSAMPPVEASNGRRLFEEVCSTHAAQRRRGRRRAGLGLDPRRDLLRALEGRLHRAGARRPDDLGRCSSSWMSW